MDKLKFLALSFLWTFICVLVGALLICLSGSHTNPRRRPLPNVILTREDLQRKRRPQVTITGNNIIHTRDEKTGKVKLVNQCTKPLEELAEAANLYVISQVTGDEEDAQVRALLASAAILSETPQRHLCCETTKGRGSIVRQLEPMLHFESSKEIADALGTVRGLNVVHVDLCQDVEASACTSLEACVELFNALRALQ